VIAFVRVDNRLIHGQVVEAWLPQLKVRRIVVADDEAAQSPLIRAAMGLAVPGGMELEIAPLGKVDFVVPAKDEVRTLVLVRDIGIAAEAKRLGLPLERLNLGNIHPSSERRQVSPSVFISASELELLKRLSSEGAEVQAQSVPSDRPVTMEEIAKRFEKGAT
jgi:PTS system mannose-specific IIB component